jgi:hypothetical protein
MSSDRQPNAARGGGGGGGADGHGRGGSDGLPSGLGGGPQGAAATGPDGGPLSPPARLGSVDYAQLCGPAAAEAVTQMGKRSSDGTGLVVGGGQGAGHPLGLGLAPSAGGNGGGQGGGNGGGQGGPAASQARTGGGSASFLKDTRAMLAWSTPCHSRPLPCSLMTSPWPRGGRILAVFSPHSAGPRRLL